MSYRRNFPCRLALALRNDIPLGSLFLFGHLFLSYFTDVKRNNDYTIICRLGAMEDAWRTKRYMHKNTSIPRDLDHFARYGSGRDAGAFRMRRRQVLFKSRPLTRIKGVTQAFADEDCQQHDDEKRQ